MKQFDKAYSKIISESTDHSIEYDKKAVKVSDNAINLTITVKYEKSQNVSSLAEILTSVNFKLIDEMEELTKITNVTIFQDDLKLSEIDLNHCVIDIEYELAYGNSMIEDVISKLKELDYFL